MKSRKWCDMAMAHAICVISGIDPVDACDGSPNWWMFQEEAREIIDDLISRGILKEGVNFQTVRQSVQREAE